MDLIYFLKNLPAFDEFQTSHLNILAGLLTLQSHDDQHCFIRQSQQGAALYLLLEGSVRVTRHDAAGAPEYELRELGEGEMFGMLSLIDDLPAQATCTAKGPGKSAALSREAYRQLFHDASPIGHHLQYMIAVQMARELQEANKRFRSTLDLS